MLEDPAVEKIGQNLKYDMIVLRAAGVRLAGVAFDTMVASYLLEAGRRNHNLDELARSYLGHETIKITELIGTGKNQKRMDEVPVRRVADYAGEDAWVPVRLRPILAEKLARRRIERPVHDPRTAADRRAGRMEYNGIKVDVERLGELSRRYGQRMEELETEIHRLAGRPLNIASPKQLQELLFDELKLPVVKKTQDGPQHRRRSAGGAGPAASAAGQDPRVSAVCQAEEHLRRRLAGDGLPRDGPGPRLVQPGRGGHRAAELQRSEPAKHPGADRRGARNPLGVRARPARAGCCWRPTTRRSSCGCWPIFPATTGCAEAFARDEDIHARVASQVNGVPLDEVTPEMRRAAKAVNFGVIYGQSPFGLAERWGSTRTRRRSSSTTISRGIRGSRNSSRRVLAECRENGYVKTILGRRRAISGVARRRRTADGTLPNGPRSTR